MKTPLPRLVKLRLQSYPWLPPGAKSSQLLRSWTTSKSLDPISNYSISITVLADFILAVETRKTQLAA